MEFLCFVASYVRSIPFIGCESRVRDPLRVYLCFGLLLLLFFVYIFFSCSSSSLRSLFFFCLMPSDRIVFFSRQSNKTVTVSSVWNIKSQQNVVVAKISVFRQWNILLSVGNQFSMFRILYLNRFYPTRGQSSVKKFILSEFKQQRQKQRFDSFVCFISFTTQKKTRIYIHRNIMKSFWWHRHWNELKINLWQSFLRTLSIWMRIEFVTVFISFNLVISNET